MAKLVLDVIRRSWQSYAMNAALVGVIFALAPIDPRIPFAASMLMTATNGAWLGGMVLTPREFMGLPLTQSQIWRARWLMTLTVPVTIVGFGKLASLWIVGGVANAMPAVLLSGCLDTAYVALCCALMMAVVPRLAKASNRSPMFSFLGVVCLLFVPFGPIVLGRWLPTTWRDVGAATMALAASAVCAGIAGFLSPPASMFERLRFQWRSSPTSAVSIRSARPVALLLRLMWPELALYVGMVILFAATFAAVDAVMASPADGDALLGTPILYWLAALVFSQVPSTFGPAVVLRLLRMLPIPTGALAVLVAANPVVLWILIWILTVAAPSSLRSAIPPLSFALLASVIGVHSLLRAVWMDGPGRLVRGTITLLGMVLLVKSWDSPGSTTGVMPALSAIASCGLPTGVWLTYRAITRGSEPYRPAARKLPFGAASPIQT